MLPVDVGRWPFPLCSALVRQVWSAVPNTGLPSTRDMDLLGQVLQRPTKVIKGLGHLSYVESDKAGPVRPGEEEAERNHVSAYKHLMRGVKTVEQESSQWCPVYRWETTGTNLKGISFKQEKKRIFFFAFLQWRWSNTGTSYPESPSLEILKTQLTSPGQPVVGDLALSTGLGLISGAAFLPQLFCDSVLQVCGRKKEFLKEELLKNASARKVGFLVFVNTIMQATKLEFLGFCSHEFHIQKFLHCRHRRMVAHLATWEAKQSITLQNLLSL